MHTGRLTRQQLLLVPLFNSEKPLRASELRDRLVELGFPEASGWNISRDMKRAKGLVVSVRGYWQVTAAGRQACVQALPQLAKCAPPVARPVVSSLRDHLKAIDSPQVRSFLEEAVLCYEQKLYRAAVVLSWVGAMGMLYQLVLDAHLAEFNAEARRRNSGWRDAKTADGLARMKESDFLDTADAIGVIGKSVKQELKRCLDLRNGCGHPNSLRLADSAVGHHLEMLMLNVFEPAGRR